MLRRLLIPAVLTGALIGSAAPSAGAPAQPGAALYALSLVSRSGTQREIAVEEELCPPNAGCSVMRLPIGTEFSRVTVVRPGERVRIVGLVGDPYASFLVGKLPTSCPPVRSKFMATISRTRIDRDTKFIRLTPSGRWNTNLKPGFYFLSSSLIRRKANSDRVTHTGLLGILVSDTQPLGTVPAPRC